MSSTRSRRTLISEVRRSPRIKSQDVQEKAISLGDSPPVRKKRIPTPPRVSKAKKLLDPSDINSAQGNTFLYKNLILRIIFVVGNINRSAQVTTEFSDDDLSACEEESPKTRTGGLFTNYLFQGLWTSFNNAEDKGCKQQTSSDSGRWSKRNLFAIFVLIPLIIVLLGLNAWSMSNGVTISLSPVLAWLQWPYKTVMAYLAASTKIQVDNQQSLDVDLLIEKILSHDKFNELVTATSHVDSSEKAMYFAKTRLETMENELKAANQALVHDMETKINKVKAQSKEWQQVDEQNMNDIKGEFEKLKAKLLDDENNREEMVALQNKIDDLLVKHDDLASKLANCQKDIPSQEELIVRLKEGLMTKSEFMTKLDESQENLRYGLENRVLEKVRNDQEIMETMRLVLDQRSNRGSGAISNDDVVSIVHEALTVYDADKTGLFDFALESAGGTIASIRCTETYDVTQVLDDHYTFTIGNSFFFCFQAVYHIMGVPIWWEKQNPRTILQPGSSPGQCWAFKGAQGSAVIKLSNPVMVNQVTLEHIPKTLSPDGSVASAPRNFEVLGLVDVDDPNPVLLGNFTYDTEKVKNPVQTFQVNKSVQAFSLVELKILSNYGHPQYTCLYRFRVHGSLEDTTHPKAV